jgi:exoribonuclease R
VIDSIVMSKCDEGILTVQIHDRNYTSWSFASEGKSYLVAEFQPLDRKLFHGDQIYARSNHKSALELHHSPTRHATHISGVLVLEGNKTYGRTPNKKRLYYRVIPEQPTLPCFLVPYDVKPNFLKDMKNKYVLFHVDHWTEKHPVGTLVEVLGDVDKLDAFYEYQLYSKSLNSSLKEFTKYTQECTKKQSTDAYIQTIAANPDFDIEDRTNVTHILTMDPPHSVDFDDALSIQSTPNDGTTVTVYLANVFVWIETMRLWHAFSNRVATVYLPDRRRPMLPSILSDTLCSLQQDQPRFALAIDFVFESSNPLPTVSFRNTMIQVQYNCTYEQDKLLKHPTYQTLLAFTQQRSQKSLTSPEVVAYWMVEANKVSAARLAQHETGVFRTVKSTMETGLPAQVESEQAIQQWLSCSGQYETYRANLDATPHLFLKTTHYVQLTSPIRRLVDLINQMMICRTMGTCMSHEAHEFVDKWIQQLDYINTSMRSIRKVQTDCTLLHQCIHHPNVLSSRHEGIVFDKIIKQNGLYGYMVYLEKLKWLSRITTNVDVENRTNHPFQLFLFESEDRTKKKIRVQFVRES